MKLALLTTDVREHEQNYANATPSFGTAPQGLLDGLVGRPEVEVHVIACLHKQPAGGNLQLADNIWYHPVVVGWAGWLKSGYIGCILGVRRKLASLQPDVVHGQGTERDCAMCAVFSGRPNVLTIHGHMAVMADLFKARPLSFYWLAARLEKLSLGRAGGVVCITDYTRKQVAAAARKTWIVPNAVDHRFFDIPLRPSSPPRLLCVGTIYPLKNQNLLLAAAAAIPSEIPFEIHFFGHVDEASPYGKEFLTRVAASPRFSYRGFADRDELRREFSEASGVLLPSLEDNCPMVVLEGMAAGVPVLAGNVGGVPELITDGVTGLLCDTSSAEAVNLALLRLLSRGPELDGIVQRARVAARERFHPTAIAEQHLAIYREICSQPGSGS